MASEDPHFAGQREPQIIESELEEFVITHQDRAFELEALLPMVETVDEIHEYESYVAGQTYLSLEEVLAGEPLYEQRVQRFMELVNHNDVLNEAVPFATIPFNANTYQTQLMSILQVIEALDLEDEADLFEQLETEIDASLDTLETHVLSNPVAVQYLRKYVKLAVYVKLLQGEGMGLLMEPYVTEMIEEFRL